MTGQLMPLNITGFLRVLTFSGFYLTKNITQDNKRMDFTLNCKQARGNCNALRTPHDPRTQMSPEKLVKLHSHNAYLQSRLVYIKP